MIFIQDIMDDSISLRLGTIIALNNIGIAFLQRLRYNDALDALNVVSTLIAAELVHGPTEDEPILTAMEILSREMPALRNVERNKFERRIKITAVLEQDAKKVIQTNRKDLMKKHEAKPILLEANSTSDDDTKFPLHAKFGAVVHNLAVIRSCKMIAELGFVRDDLNHIDYNMTLLFDLSTLMLTESHMDPMAEAMYFRSIKTQPKHYVPGPSSRGGMMSRRRSAQNLEEDIGPGGLRIPANMQKMQSYRSPAKSHSGSATAGKRMIKMVSFRTSIYKSHTEKEQETEHTELEVSERQEYPTILPESPAPRRVKTHSLRNIFKLFLTHRLSKE